MKQTVSTSCCADEEAGVQARGVQVIGNAGKNEVLDRSVVDYFSAWWSAPGSCESLYV